VKGRVKDTNLDTYTPLRMGDVPEMDIEFLPSTEVPTGLGEPATTVVGRRSETPYLPRPVRACATCQSARMQFCGLSTQRADHVGGSTLVQG